MPPRLPVRRRSARRALGCALVLGCGLLALAFVLDRRPLRTPWLDASNPEAGGDLARRAGPAPCLLVTDAEAIRASAAPGPDGARDFDRVDWAVAWTNVLEQELGGSWAHLDVTELNRSPWAGRRLVILARGAAAALPADARAALEAFVGAGGVLLLDRPGPAWRPLSGVELTARSRARARVTAASPRLLGERTLADLRALPLPAGLHELADEPDFGARVALEMDGRPAIVARPAGRGLVVTLAFDLPGLVVRLQQGVPLAPDLALGKRWGFYDQVIETHDLAWDEAYLDQRVPAADVLERAVLSAARLGAPLPGLWPFPDGAHGLLLMTHDEDGYEARRCAPLLDYEASIGAEATYFLLAPRRVQESWPADEVARFTAAGADLQLHWNRLPMVSGVWKVEPFDRVHSLAEQADNLRAALSAGGARAAPLLNRNHYLVWASLGERAAGDTEWARTFRHLAAAGVALDSTYGPNRGGKGYLFGTGRPYRPLDADGTRFALYEMPFVSQEDWGGETEAWFRALFAESAERYHCAIACILHPHLIVTEPAGERLWKAIHTLAREHDHPAVSLARYHAFLEGRNASRLDWAVEPDGGLAIEVDARVAGLAVVLPAAEGAAPVTLDGVPVATLARAVDGLPVRLVPVPLGRHRVRVAAP